MIKKCKIDSKLIAEQADIPNTGYELSPDELDRVTAFYSLLIKIDRRNKAKEKASSTHAPQHK
ncbi:MAG: hypothetical protein ACHQVS_02120 [Candidatus Babeliales bacterium]